MTEVLSDEITLLRTALDRLHASLEDIALRGVRVAGASDIAKLSALADEFRTAGAGHLSERLDAVVQAICNNNHEAVVLLLRAMTSARLFDRVLTLDVCACILEEHARSSCVERSQEEA